MFQVFAACQVNQKLMCAMQAYEYYADVLPDGHLSIPEHLKEKVKPNSRVRVMLLLEAEETVWDKLTVSQFVQGYSEADSLYDNL